MAVFYVDMLPVGGVPVLTDGQSPSAPLYGLDKISRLTLSAGDVVALRAGAVFELAVGEGPFVIHARGSVDAPVRVTRYGAGENPLIRARGDIGVAVMDSRFVKFDCLDVEGGHQAGVRIDEKSHDLTFENMIVSDSGFGFEIHGHHSFFHITAFTICV
jgi:hypothetical protein